MAEYLRFEIYIPRSYTEIGVDDEGHPYKKRHYVDQDKLREFLSSTQRKFGGVTQSNPHAPSMLKGWWLPSKQTGEKTTQEPVDVVFDFLEFVMCLIPIMDDQNALEHFTYWKKKFEEDLKQDYVLVMYSSIQTLGDYF